MLYMECIDVLTINTVFFRVHIPGTSRIGTTCRYIDTRSIVYNMYNMVKSINVYHQ